MAKVEIILLGNIENVWRETIPNKLYDISAYGKTRREAKRNLLPFKKLLKLKLQKDMEETASQIISRYQRAVMENTGNEFVYFNQLASLITDKHADEILPA